MTRRRRFWAKHFGPYRCRVRVHETPSGIIYAEIRHRGQVVRRSLEHRDREVATAWARQIQAELELGLTAVATPTPTARRVFDAYLAAVSPDHTPATQASDRRTAAMWARILGEARDLRQLSDTDRRSFVRRRASGEIDAQGRYAAPAERRPVRARAVAADLEWIRGVLDWATEARDPEGRYYLRENPVRGFDIPKEKNPRRPVATQDRLEALLAVAGDVHPFLPDLLTVVNGTGRRISAVLHLQYEDWRPAAGPQGSIHWRADTDKTGTEWTTPVNAAVRAVVERILRERPGIGAAYLFPAPRDRARPVSKRVATAWLAKAEDLVRARQRAADVPELSNVPGSGWHAYRRKWATERKGLSDVDVARAGGWSDPRCLKTIYQQPDPATLYAVVSRPAFELREAKHG